MIYTKEMIEKINLRKEKRKKIINIVSFPLLIIMIFFVLNMFFQRYVQSKKNIDFFGMQSFIVITGSMEPNINIGDFIISKKVSQNELKVGDVITFRLSDEQDTITHRIINIIDKDEKKLYQTKGDNNDTPDKELIDYEKIVGRVSFRIPKIGKYISYVFTGTGITVIILIMLLHYTFTNERKIRILAREEARKLYNIPKYKKKEESV